MEMKTILLLCFCFMMFGCEQSDNVSLIETSKKYELKNEQFAFDYEGCKIYGQIAPLDMQTKGSSDNVRLYNLFVKSEYLKKTVTTQLRQILNSDGSFILEHFVEGVKVATLFYDVKGKLYDIAVEALPSTRVASNYVTCFNNKYSALKKEYQSAVGEFVADITTDFVAPALAATAAADCAGLFEYPGIK